MLWSWLIVLWQHSRYDFDMLKECPWPCSVPVFWSASVFRITKLICQLFSEEATEATTVISGSFPCWSEERGYWSAEDCGFAVFLYVLWGDMIGGLLCIYFNYKRLDKSNGMLFCHTWQVLRQLKDKALKRSCLIEDDVLRLIKDRTQARKDKDFSKSDKIRADLTAKGIALMDVGNETIWRPCLPIGEQPEQQVDQEKTAPPVWTCW